MIREEDLREAIAECEGSRNPTAGTCLKLAAYYAILNQKYGKTEPMPEETKVNYSFASAPELAFSDSEFSKIVERKGLEKCFGILDETAQAMEIVSPKLYRGMMRKLQEL